MKGEAAALSVRAQRCQSYYFSTTPYRLITLIDYEIITVEELKEALKKQEMENHLVKIT